MTRLADVDPGEYLADVLPRPTERIRLMDLPALIPARWVAERAAAAAAARARLSPPTPPTTGRRTQGL